MKNLVKMFFVFVVALTIAGIGINPAQAKLCVDSKKVTQVCAEEVFCKSMFDEKYTKYPCKQGYKMVKATTKNACSIAKQVADNPADCGIGCKAGKIERLFVLKGNCCVAELKRTCTDK